ncbi:hypothetical protein DRP53_02110 [candidate division WOR-3 bacterium]|uniref:Lrp/AsnC family transcriptional regulator n=1 Tax=candidate division WOR-3 bacterium TaxID=2052148 RepID=A0A660SKH2_UNCW3|nr:MAG: hypothetical protein DRP53_02110 [candidate division WOR-3 bacterium]
MKVGREEVRLLRDLERGVDLTREFPGRINTLIEAGIIESFGIRLFLPLLIGGRWSLALFKISGLQTDPLHKIEFPIELGQNRSIPAGLLPELTITCYAQDPKEELARIKELKPEYVELEILREFDFPIAFPLSTEEKAIIEVLIEKPLSTINEIATKLSISSAQVRAKLSRLQLDENQKGVMTIVPTINWSRIENFIHLHIGVETGLSEEMIQGRLKEIGLESAGWYRATIYQLEFDLWEPIGLVQILRRLSDIPDLRLAGLLIAERSIVQDHWIRRVVEGM